MALSKYELPSLGIHDYALMFGIYWNVGTYFHVIPEFALLAVLLPVVRIRRDLICFQDASAVVILLLLNAR